MAEFLWRGWNVALPEVDVGDDVLVVEDATGVFSRIQVKTATAKAHPGGYSAQFSVPLRQLDAPRIPDLIYVFAVRGRSGWEPFVIIGRRDLRRERQVYGAGSVSGENLILRFTSNGSNLECSRRDFLKYRNDWSRWPVLTHSLPEGARRG